MLNIKFSEKEPDTKCRIHFDDSVKWKPGEREAFEAKMQEEEAKKKYDGPEKKIGGKAGNMFLESAMSKEDRVMKLKVMIDNGKLTTFEEAEKVLGVSTSTIKGYLKEMDMVGKLS